MLVGDVVITQLPYTDLTAIVIRPVLVVADVGPGDWVVCQITSRGQNRPGTYPLPRPTCRQEIEAGQLGEDRPGCTRLTEVCSSLLLAGYQAPSSVKSWLPCATCSDPTPPPQPLP